MFLYVLIYMLLNFSQKAYVMHLPTLRGHDALFAVVRFFSHVLT